MLKTGDSITITKEEWGFCVSSGILSETHLGPDEALWCVVGLLTGTGRGYLRTPIEHAIWEAKYRCPKNLLTASTGGAR